MNQKTNSLSIDLNIHFDGALEVRTDRNEIKCAFTLNKGEPFRSA